MGSVRLLNHTFISSQKTFCVESFSVQVCTHFQTFSCLLTWHVSLLCLNCTKWQNLQIPPNSFEPKQAETFYAWYVGINYAELFCNLHLKCGIKKSLRGRELFPSKFILRKGKEANWNPLYFNSARESKQWKWRKAGRHVGSFFWCKLLGERTTKKSKSQRPLIS